MENKSGIEKRTKLRKLLYLYLFLEWRNACVINNNAIR